MLDAYRSSFKWRWLSFKTRYTKQCLWSGLPWFLRIDWQWAWTNATTWPLSYNSYSIALIEGCTSPKRREGGSLILRCQGGRRRPEATDALVIQLTPCCQSVLAAGKSRGFGRFYLLLDLNQWLSPYESDTLTAESSRSSWVKSEKIEPYKRKPRNQTLLYKGAER